MREFRFNKMSNAPRKILHRGHFEFDRLFDTADIVAWGELPASLVSSEQRSSCNMLVQRKEHMEMWQGGSQADTADGN